MKRVIIGVGGFLCMLVVGMVGQAFAYEKPTVGFVQNLDGIESPERVSTSSSGTIYVTDSYENEVIILDSSGSKVGSIRESGVPRGIKVLPDNSILVGYTSDSGGYVSLYTSSGSFIRRLGAGIGQFTMPTDITVNPSTGVIYVVDSVRNYVYRFDKDGNFLDRFGGYGPGYYDSTGFHNQFDYPAGIAFDAARQEVLVGDQGNFRIKVFDTAGNYLRQFGTNAPDSSWIFGAITPEKLIGRFSKLQGLAVDSQSRLYVIDSFQCTVQMFDIASGDPLGMFGDYGTGSAELMTPIGITLSSSGQFILADWNNNRLSFWQIGLVTPPPAPTPNTAPSTPSPALPASGATLATLSPMLTTGSSTDAEGHALKYEFQVANNSAFTGATTYSSTTTSVAAGLLADHSVYFWRVRAVETSTPELLASAWSVTRSFEVHVSNRVPSIPSNLAPASGTVVTGTDTLSWLASTDPDAGDTVSYVIEIADQPDFVSILETKTTASTSISVSSLTSLTNGSYYWRVKAVDNRGAASAPAFNSFTYNATATLNVSSTPSGAMVYIDGNYGYLGTYKGQTGSTPLSIMVKAGRHVVRVVRSGYNEFYGTYDVSAGQTVAVSAAMSTYSSYSFSTSSSLTAGGMTLGNNSPDFSYSAPFAVDWNNDGKKDLLVGASDGNVYYYINNGTDSAQSLSFAGSVINTGDGAYPFVIDWNNDGKKDLLVGTISGTVLLYINNGTDSAPSFSGGVPVQAGGLVIDVGSYAAPTVVDWNNDGKKDLLVGNSTGYVRLYLNGGIDDNPSLTDNGYLVMQSMYSTSTLKAGTYATPQVIDWDRDGKKDLVVGSSSGVYWFRNGGTDAAPVFSSSSRPSDSTNTLSSRAYAVPFVLDWNNSAPLDMLVGASDGTVRVYRK